MGYELGSSFQNPRPQKITIKLQEAQIHCVRYPKNALSGSLLREK